TQESRIIWGNGSAGEWLGLVGDGIRKSSIAQLFAADDFIIFSSYLQNVQRQDSGRKDCQISTFVAGKKREVLWSFKPFKAVSDRRGLIILVTAQDITDALQSKMKATKMEAELETAKLIQNAFFPPVLIQNDRLSIASYYRPADQCSGDWWGYFDLGHGIDLLIIADVTGHGAAAALVTAVTQTSCRIFAETYFQKSGVLPSRLLHDLNRGIIETFKGRMHMTALALVIDRKTNRITFSNAAHIPPLMLRQEKDGHRKLTSLVALGNLVGSSLDSVFEDGVVEALAGDRFILYSDGITEARNPKDRMFGPGNLRRSALAHADLELTLFRDRLIEDAFRYYDGRPIEDDFTLVTFDLL
ncbi:MAG: hypothetical protein EOP10_27540, partial [Proteobacteria bacterium]